LTFWSDAQWLDVHAQTLQNAFWVWFITNLMTFFSLLVFPKEELRIKRCMSKHNNGTKLIKQQRQRVWCKELECRCSRLILHL